MNIGTPSPPLNRIEAMNKPMTCTECGSSHFYSVDVQQFATGGYGSSEFRPLTNNPQSMKVCICGNPVSPTAQAGGGKTALGERERYQHSLTVAREHRAKLNMQAIAKATASREELKQLEGDLNVLSLRVSALAESLSAYGVKEEAAKEPNDGTKTSPRPSPKR